MLRFGSGRAAIVIGLCLGASVLQAADTQSARHYGAGVHDFYRGQYFEAVRQFDLAVGYDSQDPRVYFFRGLAKQRLGWTADARSDFLLGSQLEVALKRRDVGIALQRIQGPDRLAIEEYRRDARKLPEELVRSVIPKPATPLVQPSAPPRPAKTDKSEYVLSNLPADSSDPFGAESPGLLGRGELQPVVEPTAASVANDAEPFADDFGQQPFGSGVVAEAESDEQMQDPFAMGDDATDPGANTAAPAAAKSGRNGGALGAARAFSRTIVPSAAIAEQGEKMLSNVRGGGPQAGAADDADPFGAPADDADPFGAPADSAPASQPPAPAGPRAPAADASDPFGAPADDADPFGAPADSAPASQPPAPAGPRAPAADASDPFGAPADDADPFGAPADSAPASQPPAPAGPRAPAADASDPFGAPADDADPLGAPADSAAASQPQPPTPPAADASDPFVDDDDPFAF